MFGYILVNRSELKVRELERYHAFYCGLCETLRKRYGMLGQMTLSYDMTFLILLLSSLYELKETSCAKRCKVHPVRKRPMIMTKASEYAADMEMILSYEHLQDDWKDEKKVSSALMGFLIRRRVRKTSERYAAKIAVFRRELTELHKLEEAKEQSFDLASDCFGRMMAAMFEWKNDQWSEKLRQLGFYIGKFIYLMDAYDDYEKDCRTDNYNVFRRYPDPALRRDAAKTALTSMMAQAAAVFDYFPIEQDLPILENILFNGVWSRWAVLHNPSDKKMKKHP